MDTWTTKVATKVSAPQEVQVVTRRRDASLRRPRIIWVVSVGGKVFVRSTNGRGADWFRWALATGTGQLISRGTHEVAFVEADETDLPAVDAAYRSKYAHYASIVDHLLEPGPRGATVQVLPVGTADEN